MHTKRQEDSVHAPEASLHSIRSRHARAHSKHTYHNCTTDEHFVASREEVERFAVLLRNVPDKSIINGMGVKPIINDMGVKPFYSGFETCFSPRT